MSDTTGDAHEHPTCEQALDGPDSCGQRERDGKARRQLAPRDSFGAWAPAPDRNAPVARVLGQDTARVADLVGVRHERMASR